MTFYSWQKTDDKEQSELEIIDIDVAKKDNATQDQEIPVQV